MKTCINCKCEKTLDQFYKDKYSSDGKEKRCRDCILKMRSKNYYKNHEINREKARIKALDFRKNNKGYQRKYDLKRIYGITLEEYNQMLISQNNSCAICKSTNPEGKHNKFVVDHCHKNGHVRALLCTRCNLGIGAFKDNVDNLQSAINYLNKYNRIKNS